MGWKGWYSCSSVMVTEILTCGTITLNMMNYIKYMKQLFGPKNNLELLPRFTNEEPKTQGGK